MLGHVLHLQLLLVEKPESLFHVLHLQLSLVEKSESLFCGAVVE